jgi:hypothetical protein
MNHHMGDIGDPVREVEFEPLPASEPVREPAPAPLQPVPA